MQDCREAMQRSSALNPAFQTTTPQRALPFYAQGTPDPGAYEPYEPRLKDLKAQGGDAWRQAM
jgi:hypothetical protein